MSVEPYPTSWIFYGDPGAQKSTLAATFPKPMLVFCFDQPGKDRPYWRRGKHSAIEDVGGIPTRLVHNEKGRLLIQIESFRNASATKPEAMAKFRRRMQHVEALLEEGKFKTVVFDSLTGIEMIARHEAQHKLVLGREPRKWYDASMSAIQELVYVRATGLVDLGVHVVATAHVNTNKRVVTKGNEIVVEDVKHNPAAPGQLAGKLPGGFAECYYCHVRTERGEAISYIQTEPTAKHNATTQFARAVNGMGSPTFKSIWAESEE